MSSSGLGLDYWNELMIFKKWALYKTLPQLLFIVILSVLKKNEIQLPLRKAKV